MSTYGGGLHLEASCKVIVKDADTQIVRNVLGRNKLTVCPRVHEPGGGTVSIVGAASASDDKTILEVSNGATLRSNAATDGGAVFIVSPIDTMSSTSSDSAPSLYSDGVEVTVLESPVITE